MELTEKQFRALKMFHAGNSTPEIAKMLNLNPSTISKWKNLPVWLKEWRKLAQQDKRRLTVPYLAKWAGY